MMAMWTVEQVRTLGERLANLDLYITEQIQQQSRDEVEKILLQGVFEAHEPTQARLRAHYGDQLARDLKAAAVALRAEVEAEAESVQRQLNREDTAWDKALDRTEYAHQAQRAAARVRALTSPAELRQWVEQAQTRPELEAVRDALPAVFDRGLPFENLDARREINRLLGEVDRKLQTQRPSSYLDALERAERHNAHAQTVVSTLQAVNERTGGLLNAELGLSLFAPAQEPLTPATKAPAGMFGG